MSPAVHGRGTVRRRARAKRARKGGALGDAAKSGRGGGGEAMDHRAGATRSGRCTLNDVRPALRWPSVAPNSAREWPEASKSSAGRSRRRLLRDPSAPVDFAPGITPRARGGARTAAAVIANPGYATRDDRRGVIATGAGRERRTAERGEGYHRPSGAPLASVASWPTHRGPGRS